MKTVAFTPKTRRVLLMAAAMSILMQLPVFCGAQTKEQIELISWMVFYYQKPVSEEFPGKLAAFSKAGLLNDEKKQFPFLGFASTVFRDNAARLNAWLPTIDALPEDHRKVVLLSLWLSGSRESNELFRRGKYKNSISGQNYFNFETNESPPDLNIIDPIYGGFLDIQWGRFLASGKKEPVRLIVSALQFGEYWGAEQKYTKPLTEDQKREIIKEAHFKAALWSLRSNAETHPLVKKYCSELYEGSELSSTEKKYLGMLLSQIYPEKYGRK